MRLSQLATSPRFSPWARLATAVAILAMGITSIPLHAQLSSATVTGVVRDSSGSVIPGVHLVLRNVDTTVEHTSQSNSTGNYVFLNITPGQYTLSATASGFQTTNVPQFNLAV